jgi:hypothetical protein
MLTGLAVLRSQLRPVPHLILGVKGLVRSSGRKILHTSG